MAKVLVMRYDKGKLPPSALTDEFKQLVGGAMEKYLKENPQVKFNGLWVNEEGMESAIGRHRTQIRLKSSSTVRVDPTTK